MRCWPDSIVGMVGLQIDSVYAETGPPSEQPPAFDTRDRRFSSIIG
jgi:hypothetical protein